MYIITIYAIMYISDLFNSLDSSFTFSTTSSSFSSSSSFPWSISSSESQEIKKKEMKDKKSTIIMRESKERILLYTHVFPLEKPIYLLRFFCLLLSFINLKYQNNNKFTYNYWFIFFVDLTWLDMTFMFMRVLIGRMQCVYAS